MSRHFNIENISDGVYAAIAKEGTGSVSNAGIINVGEHSIIFDTFNTQQASEDLNQTAFELTGHSRHHVINSHWHGDHIRGNQAFKDSIIFSTNTTLNYMKDIHPDRISYQKSNLAQLENDIRSINNKLQEASSEILISQLSMQISFLREIALSLPTLELTLPTVTFESKLTFYGSKRSVEVIPVGAGHTQCDTVLYLPDEKILFGADICTNANHPLLIDGDPDNWIIVLDKLLDSPIRTVIPGHGQIGSKEILALTRQYICDMKELVELSLTQSNFDINEVRVPERYENWGASANLYNNLRFLMNVSNQI